MKFPSRPTSSPAANVTRTAQSRRPTPQVRATATPVNPCLARRARYLARDHTSSDSYFAVYWRIWPIFVRFLTTFRSSLVAHSVHVYNHPRLASAKGDPDQCSFRPPSFSPSVPATSLLTLVTTPSSLCAFSIFGNVAPNLTALHVLGFLGRRSGFILYSILLVFNSRGDFCLHLSTQHNL